MSLLSNWDSSAFRFFSMFGPQTWSLMLCIIFTSYSSQLYNIIESFASSLPGWKGEIGIDKYQSKSKLVAGKEILFYYVFINAYPSAAHSSFLFILKIGPHWSHCSHIQRRWMLKSSSTQHELQGLNTIPKVISAKSHDLRYTGDEDFLLDQL